MKGLALLSLVLGVALVVAGVVVPTLLDNSDDSTTYSPELTPSPTPITLEVVDDLGRSVSIEGDPQRIVSLAPSVTEVLFALDLGNELVGVTDHCDYPSQALDKPMVGGYYTTSLEAIVAQDPDVVFYDGHDPVGAQLEELGIAVVVLQPVDIDGIYGDIELVGLIMGKESEADALVAEMQGRIDAVSAAVAGAERPTVFYEIDASNLNAPWTVGPGSFIHTLIELAGGRNIVEVDQAYFQITLEEIVASDPDVIILGDHPWVATEDVLGRSGAWQGLAAIVGEAVYPIELDLTSRPGPRIVDGLEAMAEIIHPELFP